MIKLVTPWLFAPGFAAMSVGPFILVKRKELLTNKVYINHETIHYRQQLELLFVGMWILYLFSFLYNLCRGYDANKAYKQNMFEAEAYAHEKDLDYLSKRKPYAWL